MSGGSAQSRSKSATSAVRATELEVALAAVNKQRIQDQERLSQVTRERDRLKFELAERDAIDVRALKVSASGVAELAPINEWGIKSGVERAKRRDEPAISGSIVARLTATLLLRFARAAAKSQRYATAEVLYQAITLLAPRGFVWRQTGNMLAAQGLYLAAVDCFDRALEFDETDSEAWHAKGMALRRADRTEEGMMALERAFALNPELTKRRDG